MTEPIKPATDSLVKKIKLDNIATFGGPSQFNVDRLIARIESDATKLAERDTDLRLRMLDWRGIEDGQECSKCGGSGTLAYSSTATWRGGAGGSTVTTDVCATCWGSGTKHPWPSWRSAK